MVHTASVGNYKTNLYGLYDVLGNASEWTCSAYAETYEGAERRCVTEGVDGRRSLRGGAWTDGPAWVRSANRYWSTASDRDSLVGIRLFQDAK